MSKLLRYRKLNKLKHFDYSSSGYYFVTICTKHKEELLGEIVNRKMVLNQHGEVVSKCWFQIPNYYRNIELDEFMIMPNHMHGIIIIKNNKQIVGTEHCSVPTNTNNCINKRYGLLSKIIKSFKEITIKTIHKKYNNYSFQWQKSFYDHIIRNETSLHEIRQYIRYNPIKWDEDKNNVENIFM